jgi:hypothetical protein
MSKSEFETVLPSVVKKLEEIAGVKVAQNKIDDVVKQAVHIVIHELAHAYVERALPWLSKIEDDQHTLIDEVLARFLERRVSKELSLFVESFEEQLKELRMYSPLRNLSWDVDFYGKLYDDFEKHVRQGGNLESFAKKESTKRLRV